MKKKEAFQDIPFDSIDEIIEEIKLGHMVIVTDDEDRENEGDLIMAAEKVTSEKMAFMIRHTGGVVCMPLSNEIADRLKLPLMTEKNTSKFGTAFSISIEAASGVTTGISAADRACTILTAIRPDSSPEDLSRPGHVFPLRGADGGVLKRAGHTEASIDLAQLAGLRAGAVLSELMHDDGTMMRLPDLLKFKKKHGLKMCSIRDLIAYRRQREKLVVREQEIFLPTEYGDFQLFLYRATLDGQQHLALVKGPIDPLKPALVRVHSECFSETFLDHNVVIAAINCTWHCNKFKRVTTVCLSICARKDAVSASPLRSMLTNCKNRDLILSKLTKN